MQTIYPQKEIRESPMQTLGSFDLLYWKTCDQERWWICMPPLQELHVLVLKSLKWLTCLF